MTETVEIIPVMPVEIVKAIVGVMGVVRKLGKEGNNTFQRYKFTSVDQFYESLGPLMSAHGLVDIAIERSMAVEMREASDDRGTVKKSAWLIAEVEFWLHHVSGASYGPILRRIQVPASGAQSYASAHSYLEKYFLRNLFKVPSGDLDEIDLGRAGGLPEDKRPTFITDEQVEELDSLLVFLGEDTDRRFKQHYKVEFISQLTDKVFPEALKKLKEKKAAVEAAANE